MVILWFDYPLDGNAISLIPTDIIAHLGSMGNISPFILNISQWGDATTAEMSWPKQQRMITAIQDPSNWLDSGKPDAILFSGGGNDVAGDQFAVFLDYAGFARADWMQIGLRKLSVLSKHHISTCLRFVIDMPMTSEYLVTAMIFQSQMDFIQFARVRGCSRHSTFAGTI